MAFIGSIFCMLFSDRTEVTRRKRLNVILLTFLNGKSQPAYIVQVVGDGSYKEKYVTHGITITIRKFNFRFALGLADI